MPARPHAKTEPNPLQTPSDVGQIAYALWVEMATKAGLAKGAAVPAYGSLSPQQREACAEMGEAMFDVARFKRLRRVTLPSSEALFANEKLSAEEEFAAKVSNDVTEDIDCRETRQQLREVIRALGMVHCRHFGMLQSRGDGFLLRWVQAVLANAQAKGATAKPTR